MNRLRARLCTSGSRARLVYFSFPKERCLEYIHAKEQEEFLFVRLARPSLVIWLAAPPQRRQARFGAFYAFFPLEQSAHSMTGIVERLRSDECAKAGARAYYDGFVLCFRPSAEPPKGSGPLVLQLFSFFLSFFLSFLPSFAAARIDGQGQSIRRTKPVSQLPRPFAHSDGDFNGCLCQMAVISQTIYVLYFTRPGKSSFAVSRIPSACAAQHDTTCAAKAAPASALRACCTRASELRAMAN